jgi:hypothetical protein
MIMKAEVRQDGVWTQVGKVFESALRDGMMTDRVCDERNHILFEVFGAKKTYKYEHTTINPVSHTIKDSFVVYLDDLIKYDWNATVLRKGIISEWQYKRLQCRGIEPVNKNRIVMSSEAKIVSSVEMDAILLGHEARTAQKYYVNFLYDAKTLKEHCSFFYNNSLKTLTTLIPDGGTEHCVRVVYNFIY